MAREIEDGKNIRLHMCHKCGLPREVTPRGAIDIGRCTCLSQTTFEYERVARTVREAVEIARNRYEQIRRLYMQQCLRTPEDMKKLLEKYKKALPLYQYGNSAPSHDEDEAFTSWCRDNFEVRN